MEEASSHQHSGDPDSCTFVEELGSCPAQIQARDCDGFKRWAVRAGERAFSIQRTEEGPQEGGCHYNRWSPIPRLPLWTYTYAASRSSYSRPRTSMLVWSIEVRVTEEVLSSSTTWLFCPVVSVLMRHLIRLHLLPADKQKVTLPDSFRRMCRPAMPQSVLMLGSQSPSGRLGFSREIGLQRDLPLALGLCVGFSRQAGFHLGFSRSIRAFSGSLVFLAFSGKRRSLPQELSSLGLSLQRLAAIRSPQRDEAS